MNRVNRDPDFVSFAPTRSDNREDPLTLVDDDGEKSTEDEAIGIVVPEGFCLQE